MPNRTFYVNKENDEWIKSQSNKSGLVNELIAAYRQGSNMAPTNMSVSITPIAAVNFQGQPFSVPSQNWGLTNSTEPPTLLDGNANNDLPRGLSINS